MQAFRNGLSEAGYVEGRNVRIAYRWTGGQAERLPALAAELAALGEVSVIVTLGNTQAVRAAKAATDYIPMACMLGTDPVELRVSWRASRRPGGNLTGVFNLNQRAGAEMARGPARDRARGQRPSRSSSIPRTRQRPRVIRRRCRRPRRRSGCASTSCRRAPTATSMPPSRTCAKHRAGALAIAADALFVSRVDQLAALGLHHAVPALYPFREFAAAGGLASYGTDLADTYRSAGLYTGRILNGEKPADLPVQQATKVELVLNPKTAKALGLAFLRRSSPAPTRSSNEPAVGTGGSRRGDRVRRRASGER